MKKWFPWAVVGGAILIGLLMSIGTYNSLVSKQEAAKTAWSQVENQYQRRFDLIPNLVETVKGFTKQEREILTEVTRLRSQWYPDLKSNQNFLRLQDQLEGTENRLSVERRRYNLAVQEYNVAIRRFPTNLVASMLGFSRMELFEAEKGAAQAPKVKF